MFQGVVRRWQEEAEQHFPFFSWLLSLIDAYIVTCFQKQVIVKASGNKFKYSNAVLPEKKKKKKKVWTKRITALYFHSRVVHAVTGEHLQGARFTSQSPFSGLWL